MLHKDIISATYSPTGKCNGIVTNIDKLVGLDRIPTAYPKHYCGTTPVKKWVDYEWMDEVKIASQKMKNKIKANWGTPIIKGLIIRK